MCTIPAVKANIRALTWGRNTDITQVCFQHRCARGFVLRCRNLPPGFVSLPGAWTAPPESPSPTGGTGGDRKGGRVSHSADAPEAHGADTGSSRNLSKGTVLLRGLVSTSTAGSVQRDVWRLPLSLTGHTRSGPWNSGSRGLLNAPCECKKQGRKERHTWLLCSHLLHWPLKRHV